jgi:hypothetical protein
MKKSVVGLLIFLVVVLTGCASVEIAPYQKSDYPQVPFKPQNSIKQLAQPKPKPESGWKGVGDFGDSGKKVKKTYLYGQFDVLVYEDGSQRINGGIFTDLPPLIFDSIKPHVIVINYQTKTLMYYLFEEGVHKPVIGFAVVTPSADVLKPNQIVRGVVQSIEINPTWCPTDNIRKEIKNLPKGCVPPGHPQNFMGAVKFNIKWQAKGWDLNKLHGTSGYPLGNFWNEKTFGCTRLLNEAVMDLISRLGPKAEKEGIEIIVHKDPEG